MSPIRTLSIIFGGEIGLMRHISMIYIADNKHTYNKRNKCIRIGKDAWGRQGGEEDDIDD
jgi:hypothetical protein